MALPSVTNLATSEAVALTPIVDGGKQYLMVPISYGAGYPQTPTGFRRIPRGTLNVIDFGATGDGATDDAPAINRVMRMLENGFSNHVYFPKPKVAYRINSAITLPDGVASGNTEERCIIEGDSAIVELNYDGPAFLRTVANNTDANTTIGRLVPIISGFDIEATSVTSNKVGFEIGATYGCVIRNCKVTQCDVGYRLTFGLNGLIEECYATNCPGDSFVFRSANGIWTGATTSNSSSNASRFSQCRAFKSDAATAIGFKVLASDGVAIENCISEGSAGLTDYHFDCENSTVVKRFRMTNIWCETPNIRTNILLKPRDGACIVDGVDRTYPATFIDFRPYVASTFTVSDVRYTANLDYTNWSAGTYAAGTRRQDGTNIYRALVSSSAQPSVTPAEWADEGAAGYLGADTNLSGSLLRFTDVGGPQAADANGYYYFFGQQESDWTSGQDPYSIVCHNYAQANAGIITSSRGKIAFQSLESNAELAGESLVQRAAVDGFNILAGVKAQTTSASPVNCGTIATSSNVTYFVTAHVVAMNDDFTEGAGYRVDGVFRNQGGTLAAVGSPVTTPIGEDDAALTATMDTSGTTIRCRVTGKAATTINWKSWLEYVAR